MSDIPLDETLGGHQEDEHIELPESVIKELEQHIDDSREQILILLEHFIGEDTDRSTAASHVALYLQQHNIHASAADILRIADIPEDVWTASDMPHPRIALSAELEAQIPEIPSNVSRSQFYSQKPIVNDNKVGRNDPCPCGSGKKYKKCHGAAK